MTSFFHPKTWRAACLCLVLALAAAPQASAHDPFDGNVQLFVFDQKIDVRVTLGYDASRAFLTAAHLPKKDIARLTHNAPGHETITLPLALATGLFSMTAQSQPIAATALVALPGEEETVFIAIYPRPHTDVVQLGAPWLPTIEYMHPTPLVIANGQHVMLGSALLSAASPTVEASLTQQTAGGYHPPAISAFAYFRLGVEHILTGFDHLLFLGALLVTMRRVKPMLGIITAFTVAHSITLALAAFDVVQFAPSVIEPLIAASIIVVCLENFFRREATTDRYWMAGAFGLIHGFGFAGALRETALAQPGGAIVVPLLSFNLGVETGQLCVASIVMTLLVLGRRHTPALVRYAVPALSVVVMGISAYWLAQRLGAPI